MGTDLQSNLKKHHPRRSYSRLFNQTILYLKMKIFFVLASLIYFPCSVVLDMNDCGSGISDVCQSEWDDKESVWKFYERCDAEGGSNPVRWGCSLCCPGINYIWFKCSKQFFNTVK